VPTTINCIFAAIFFISFFGKVKNMQDSILMVKSYGVVPARLLKASTIALVMIECLLAVLFILGVYRWVRDVITIVLLLFFILIILIKRRKQEGSKSCSCIGEVAFINKYPVTRNIIFIVLLLTDLFTSSHSQLHEHSPLIVLTISIMIAMLSETLAKYTFVKGYMKHDVVS